MISGLNIRYGDGVLLLLLKLSEVFLHKSFYSIKTQKKIKKEQNTTF